MSEQKSCKKTSIAGQALIEGILMRGPKKQAIVVRNQEGGLEIKESELKLIKDKYPLLGLPFIRGVFTFLGSLVNGMKALMWSAEFYPEEEEEPTKFEIWLEKMGIMENGKLITKNAVWKTLSFGGQEWRVVVTENVQTASSLMMCAAEEAAALIVESLDETAEEMTDAAEEIEEAGGQANV